MTRVGVMLDGLQDPATARGLSRAWMAAGLHNGVDPAGQWAWVEMDVGAQADPNLCAMQGAAVLRVARRFGVEPRVAPVELWPARVEEQCARLRTALAREYRQRTAQLLMFGLPALGLHYLAPVLAGGGAGTAGTLFYPWLMQMLLVGWALWAGGWSVLWQGMLSVRHGRPSGDAFVTLLIAAAFVPAAMGVMSLPWSDMAWFLGDGPQTARQPGFVAAWWAMLVAVIQRWAAHRWGDRMTGWSGLLLVGHRWLVLAWAACCVLAGLLVSWRMGLAIGLALPATASLGGVNRWMPSWASLLPAVGFAMALCFGERLLGRGSTGVELEAAGLFALVMTGVYALGWHGMDGGGAGGVNRG